MFFLAPIPYIDKILYENSQASFYALFEFMQRGPKSKPTFPS